MGYLRTYLFLQPTDGRTDIAIMAKGGKKKERRERRPNSSSTDLSSVLYMILAALVAIAALLAVGIVRSGGSGLFGALSGDRKGPAEESGGGASHYESEAYTSGVKEDVVPASPDSAALLSKDAVRAYLEPETHPDSKIRGLPSDLSRWPPGEMGIGVRLDEAKMGEAEAAKKKRMWNSHAFEEYISELISYDRSLPDWRGDWCRSEYPSSAAGLTPMSVVICFHNEAWSTLVRTVHSIVNRTPDHLLEEILLLDDASDMEHLGERLDSYMARFPKVRIVRQRERQGLIRSRMHGAEMAKGKVLTFLDSHVECGIGWAEPLLHRIKDNPKVIVSPVIDAINDTTFYYQFIT